MLSTMLRKIRNKNCVFLDYMYKTLMFFFKLENFGNALFFSKRKIYQTPEYRIHDKMFS